MGGLQLKDTATIQLVFTALGGWLGYFWGELDGFLYTLITFVVIDYMSGLMVAILNKRVSSEIGARGIFKKVLIFVMVGIGHIIDSSLINNGNTIRTAIIFFYISNEGISILENTALIGLPIPRQLKKILQQINDEESNND